MDIQLKNKIIEDIKATGFPTELVVANNLLSYAYDIEQNGTYLDYELNKSREIDIVARKLFWYKDKNCNFYFAVNLIIEVKKSTKRPWVIFTNSNIKSKASEFLGPGFSQLHHSSNFSTNRLSAFDLMKAFPRNEKPSIGTSFYEAFKSSEDTSKIYEAIMSAIKAAFYIRRQESSEDYLTREEIEEIEERPFIPDKLQRFEVYMPVVLLEGLLCEASLSKNQEIKLDEINYIPVTISHTIKPYDDNFKYYPEILNVKYFLDFLSSIDKWGNSILKLWKRK